MTKGERIDCEWDWLADAPAMRCAVAVVVASVAVLGSCIGLAYPCCSSAREGSEGVVGQMGTCYRDSTDEYGALYGHALCADDPSGNACVSVWNTYPSTPVRCADPAGPSYTVPCCTEVGPDGRGVVGTCTCVLGRRCDVEARLGATEGSVCELSGVWPCRDDASSCPIDAGAR